WLVTMSHRYGKEHRQNCLANEWTRSDASQHDEITLIPSDVSIKANNHQAKDSKGNHNGYGAKEPRGSLRKANRKMFSKLRRLKPGHQAGADEGAKNVSLAVIPAGDGLRPECGMEESFPVKGPAVFGAASNGE